MAILVNGTVYTVVGDTDPIDLQILQADGVTPRSLAGHTNIKVRLKNDADNSVIVFTKDGGKITVLDEDEGEIRVIQAGSEYTQQSVYTYYVDIIDSAGSHIVPKRQELRPKWNVAAEIGVGASPSSSPSASPSISPSVSPSSSPSDSPSSSVSPSFSPSASP